MPRGCTRILFTQNQQFFLVLTVHFCCKIIPLIEKGLLKPEEIVTHYMPFEEAARGYEIFEKREEECSKVIMVPGAQSAEAAQKAVSGLVNAMPGGTI